MSTEPKSGEVHKLHTLFKDYASFERACHTYSVDVHLEYASPREAWDANPDVEIGWDNQPVYYRRARERQDYSRFCLWEVA